MSNNPHDEFDHFLKDGVDGFEIKPKADLWNKVEQKVSRRQRFVAFVSWGTPVVFLAALIAMIYPINDTYQGAQTKPFISSHQYAAIAPQDELIISKPLALVTHEHESKVAQTFLLTDNHQQIQTLEVKPHEDFDARASELLALEPKSLIYIRPSSAVQSSAPSPLYRKKSKNMPTPKFLFECGVSLNYINKRNLEAKEDINTKALKTSSNSSSFNYSNLIGSGLHIGIRYLINERISVMGGIDIARCGYQILKTDEPPPGNSRTYGFMEDANQQLINATAIALQIPLVAGFKQPLTKKYALQLDAGIAPMIYLRNHLPTLETAYGLSETAPEARNYNISGLISAAVNYQVGGVKCAIGPEFKYNLLNTFNTSKVQEHLYSIGVRATVSCNL
jgi:hypothetical protein